MGYIDTAILDVTEWLCRRFQVLTGRTNVWLAVQLTNLSIIVYFVAAGVYFWRAGVWSRVALGVFCAGLLYGLTQTVLKVPIEASEHNAYRRVAKGLRNPRRVRDALLRISFLTLSIVLFYPILFIYINLRLPIALLSYSLIVLTTVVLYLLACDPLPPAPGKLREWLRGGAPSPLPARESAGGRSKLLGEVRPPGARLLLGNTPAHGPETWVHAEWLRRIDGEPRELRVRRIEDEVALLRRGTAMWQDKPQASISVAVSQRSLALRRQGAGGPIPGSLSRSHLERLNAWNLWEPGSLRNP